MSSDGESYLANLLNKLDRVKEDSEPLNVTVERIFRSFGMSLPVKRILIIGLEEVGKSTVKKIFFEGTDPTSLLRRPLPPTRGLSFSHYAFLSLKVTISDAAGQESTNWFTLEKEKAFSNTDHVVYMFDVNSWALRRDKVLEHLKSTIETMKEVSDSPHITVFVHKTDLVPGPTLPEYIKAVETAITEYLGESLSGVEYTFYSTTVKDLKSIFSAFQNILCDVSNLDPLIDRYLEMKSNSSEPSECPPSSM